MIFGLLLAVAGIGAACALIYRAAVYAVPFATGVWAGFAALDAGSGPLLAIAIGFVTGAIVFGIGQSVWDSSLPKALRHAVALLFVVPAMWTGYCAAQQIAGLLTLPLAWSFVLAASGAVAVGMTAFARLSASSSRTTHHSISTGLEISR
jgi:hypothetical protein